MFVSCKGRDVNVHKMVFLILSHPILSSLGLNNVTEVFGERGEIMEDTSIYLCAQKKI
jgi:hypothetical protein